MCESPLHRPRNYVDRVRGRAAVYAPSCFRAKPKILYQYCVGHKFQQVLKEILSLFPVVHLKAEQRFIIEKVMVRRDVFGQLPTGYGKTLLVRWLFFASYINC